MIDVGLSNALLLFVGIEDRGSILCAIVRPLPVKLGRIVHGEEDLEKLTIGDLRGIVDDLDGFGVSGRAGTHDVVVGRGLSASGISGHGAFHSFDVIENGFNAPKAAAG